VALSVTDPPPPKRVRVYELRDNDWFDRGTGFCRLAKDSGSYVLIVDSEDRPEIRLLEAQISEEHGFNKQQETLIVWTEPSGTDMALSFQEADGCAVVWEFLTTFVPAMWPAHHRMIYS
jgi:protein phosphatase-4 regulatory subunit 3